MDSDELFGLQRVVNDDPDWMWFLDPENYLSYLPQLQMDQDTYVEAWNEVLRVFPTEWAKRVRGRGKRSFAWTGLHPPVLGWLDHHPVAHFIAHRPYGWATAAPVLRLGLDLIRTRDLQRIQPLRRELKDLEQYPGRLFELEILSEFVRRRWSPEIIGTPDFRFQLENLHVFAEARHRGAPFGMAVSHLVHPPFDAEWHSLRITLNRVSGVRSEAADLADRINKDIEGLLQFSSDSAKIIQTTDYLIQHVQDGEPRTMTISYGRHEHYSDELENLVYMTLTEKCEQLRRVALNGHPSVLILDCRSLLSPEPRKHDEAHTVHRAKFHKRILDGGSRFLDKNEWVSGIIWWWRHADYWPAKLSEMIHEPWPISVTAAGEHFELVEPTTLAAALQK